MLKRTKGWEERFSSLVLARLCVQFEWGKQDCALWAADCVQALTGVDFAEPYRGKYKTARGAQNVLKKAGGLEAIATAALGEPIGALFASTGDVGLVMCGDHECMGVCNGMHWLVPGEEGLRMFDLSKATVAWRVG